MTRWFLGLATGVCLTVGGNAGALYGQDRPDLQDFSVSSIRDKSHNVSGGDSVRIGTFRVSPGHGNFDVRAYGSAYHDVGSDFLSIEWMLYEPDKVLRKAAKVQLQQSDYVYIDLYAVHGGSYLQVDGTAHGCKAKVDFKDLDGDGVPAAHPFSLDDKTKWKVQCSTNGLLALGLSPAQADIVKNLVSSIGSGGGSTLVSGSTR